MSLSQNRASIVVDNRACNGILMVITSKSEGHLYYIIFNLVSGVFGFKTVRFPQQGTNDTLLQLLYVALFGHFRSM